MCKEWKQSKSIYQTQQRDGKPLYYSNIRFHASIGGYLKSILIEISKNSDIFKNPNNEPL